MADDKNTMRFEDLLQLGLKRQVPALIKPCGILVELGPGKNPIPDTIGLEYPEWDGSKDPLPFNDGIVDGIYAFHFFEHFTGAQAISLLREVERVLRPGGVLTMMVPYFDTELAHQDLDHKSFWTESTLRMLFNPEYYIKGGEWKLKVHYTVIAGVVGRNLGLFAQVVKLP